VVDLNLYKNNNLEQECGGGHILEETIAIDSNNYAYLHHQLMNLLHLLLNSDNLNYDPIFWDIQHYDDRQI
jgi:hypothetical protein